MSAARAIAVLLLVGQFMPFYRPESMALAVPCPEETSLTLRTIFIKVDNTADDTNIGFIQYFIHRVPLNNRSLKKNAAGTGHQWCFVRRRLVRWENVNDRIIQRGLDLVAVHESHIDGVNDRTTLTTIDYNGAGGPEGVFRRKTSDRTNTNFGSMSGNKLLPRQVDHLAGKTPLPYGRGHQDQRECRNGHSRDCCPCLGRPTRIHWLLFFEGLVAILERATLYVVGGYAFITGGHT